MAVLRRIETGLSKNIKDGKKKLTEWEAGTTFSAFLGGNKRQLSKLVG